MIPSPPPPFIACGCLEPGEIPPGEIGCVREDPEPGDPVVLDFECVGRFNVKVQIKADCQRYEREQRAGVEP